MMTLDRAGLLALFRADVHPSIENALARDDVRGLAVYEDADGKRRATPAQSLDAPDTDARGGRLLGVYLKDRTRQAIEYLAANPGTTPYAAAKHFGLSTQVVYAGLRRAMRRQKKASEAPVCPCCGQPIPAFPGNEELP